jgi:hypothetical protein
MIGFTLSHCQITNQLSKGGIGTTAQCCLTAD